MSARLKAWIDQATARSGVNVLVVHGYCFGGAVTLAIPSY